MKWLYLLGFSYIICMVLILVPLLVAIVDPALPFLFRYLLVALSLLPLGIGVYCSFTDTTGKTRWCSSGPAGYGFISSLVILASAFWVGSFRAFVGRIPIPYSSDIVTIACWTIAGVLTFTSALVSFLLEEPGKADAAS